MSKNSKISFYSLEDIEKIGAVDNIKCHGKTFLGIFKIIFPYLFILAIINIMPISTSISKILSVLSSIIIFIFLSSIHAYDRFINFNLSINGNKIIYINIAGQIFNYNENDLLSAKYIHRYSLSGLTSNIIEINMSDNQTIKIYSTDRHFYKLMMYLEQKDLLKK